MQCKCVGYSEQVRQLGVKDGQVIGELYLNDGTDFGKVHPKVMYYIDVGTGGDCGVHLAKVLLGFAKELIGFAVVCSVFMFFARDLESGTE